MTPLAWGGLALALALAVWFLFLRPSQLPLAGGSSDVAPDDPVPANGASDKTPRFSFSFEI